MIAYSLLTRNVNAIKEQKSEVTFKTKKEGSDIVGVTMKLGEVPFRK